MIIQREKLTDINGERKKDGNIKDFMYIYVFLNLIINLNCSNF